MVNDLTSNGYVSPIGVNGNNHHSNQESKASISGCAAYVLGHPDSLALLKKLAENIDVTVLPKDQHSLGDERGLIGEDGKVTQKGRRVLEEALKLQKRPTPLDPVEGRRPSGWSHWN